jgi:hypothetical protein
MGRVQERIAAMLAAEVGSRTEWDEPPGLFWLALEGGMPGLVPAAVTPGTWLLAPPAMVLSLIADGCGEFSGPLRASAPEALHGAAFYSETWLTMHRTDDAEGIARAKADARAHRIHERPDRVEARLLWAVDRAGTVYAAMLRRGIDSEPRTQVEYPGAGRTIKGDIPAALERIVSAVLAVTLPG